MNRWLYHWNQLRDQLWVSVGLYAVMGGALALAAVLFAPFVSAETATRFGKFEAVESLLTILASSLLAVATFSLGAMVSAYTAVGAAASPRATGLVVTDRRTQNVLATFIGGFLFAIVALVAVEASYYGAEGRAIIYFGTLGVIALVAYTLLRWTDHLGRMARMSHTLDRVEGETAEAIQDRIAAPRLGARPIDETDRAGFNRVVQATQTGYVQNVDAADLQATAKRYGLTLEIACLPGTFLTDDHVVVRARGAGFPEDFDRKIQQAFTIGHGRTFDQDVRFGLIVLGEIAGKALSPAINDPGTAIAVTGIAVRLLKRWGESERLTCAVLYPDLRAPMLDSRDLVDDVLGPVSRFGSGDVAVSVRLQKALEVLKHSPDPDLSAAATHLSRVALERNRAAMSINDDLSRVVAAMADERADMA